MKSLAILALIGNISATRINMQNKFIAGEIEDDDLVN